MISAYRSEHFDSVNTSPWVARTVTIHLVAFFGTSLRESRPVRNVRRASVAVAPARLRALTFRRSARSVSMRSASARAAFRCAGVNPSAASPPPSVSAAAIFSGESSRPAAVRLS